MLFDLDVIIVRSLFGTAMGTSPFAAVTTVAVATEYVQRGYIQFYVQTLSIKLPTVSKSKQSKSPPFISIVSFKDRIESASPSMYTARAKTDKQKYQTS